MKFHLKAQNFGAIQLNRVVAKTWHQNKIGPFWVPKKAVCHVQLTGQVWLDCQGFLQSNEHCQPTYNVTTPALSNWGANNQMRHVWDSYELSSNNDCQPYNVGASMSSTGKPVRIKDNSVGSLHRIPNDTPDKVLSIK